MKMIDKNGKEHMATVSVQNVDEDWSKVVVECLSWPIAKCRKVTSRILRDDANEEEAIAFIAGNIKRVVEAY